VTEANFNTKISSALVCNRSSKTTVILHCEKLQWNYSFCPNRLWLHRRFYKIGNDVDFSHFITVSPTIAKIPDIIEI